MLHNETENLFNRPSPEVYDFSVHHLLMGRWSIAYTRRRPKHRNPRNYVNNLDDYLLMNCTGIQPWVPHCVLHPHHERLKSTPSIIDRPPLPTAVRSVHELGGNDRSKGIVLDAVHQVHLPNMWFGRSSIAGHADEAIQSNSVRDRGSAEFIRNWTAYTVQRRSLPSGLRPLHLRQGSRGKAVLF